MTEEQARGRLDPPPDQAGDATPETDEATLETDEATLETDEATPETDEATLETDEATLETDEATPATDDGRSVLGDVASTIADAAGPVFAAARRPMDSIASGARRMISDRSGARVRRVRRMAREPLANLWDLHPQAHRASIRELGLVTVPVERIVGTAVEGPPQRGGDFLPLRDRRGDDWRARWQRIRTALDELQSLPPVELIKFGDDYWVVDGHNRVAAALYNGQVEIDAIVEEHRLPGMPASPPALIASVLEGSLDLRDAGAGRLTRTVSRPTDRLTHLPPPAGDDSRETDDPPRGQPE